MNKYIVSAALIIFISIQIFVFTGSEQKELTVSIVGDILLDRGVGKEISRNGIKYPYEKIKDIVKDADITFGNLECPITTEGAPILKKRNLVFQADPSNTNALKDAGFDILNLANNHSMDYNAKGLMNTVQNLHSREIETVGAGKDREDAHKPVFIEKKGIIIGFMGYSAFPSEGYFYFDYKPGVSYANEDKLAQEIKQAKTGCDLLIVSFHWGKEFDHSTSEHQKFLAHLAVENGADVIIGHHPHVLQGVEVYRAKPIFYSLGNFVFDRQIPPGTDETMILNLKVSDKKIREAELLPVKILRCQPFKASGNIAAGVLNNLKSYSKRMNSNIEIMNEKGYLFLGQ